MSAGASPHAPAPPARPARARAAGPADAPPQPNRRWWLALLALPLLVLTDARLWSAPSSPLWFPSIGLGLALVAWAGLGAAVLVGVAGLLAALLAPAPVESALAALLGAVLVSLEVAGAWWCYHERAAGTRRLDDPRSATVFIILVPGAVAGLAAVLLALVQHTAGNPTQSVAALAASLWVGHGLGILALAPPLLTLATPGLVRRGLARADPAENTRARRFLTGDAGAPLTRGDRLEAGGLALGAAGLGVVLAVVHAQAESVNWHLWGLLLLVVVWAGLRQGLAGGSLAASSAAVLALLTAGALVGDAGQTAALRGHLLAQCTTALLVGASAGWIRASETRYRQFVGHMPVVLYSARLHDPSSGAAGRPAPGPPKAEVTLVSPASRAILGCEPEELVGDYSLWLARVHPDDRELLIAALAQLCRQREPVVCEYRLAVEDGSRSGLPSRTEMPLGSRHLPEVPLGSRHLLAPPPSTMPRWARDRMAPHYLDDGRLEGWEGVVEDITEQRALASNLRRTTNMLQALLAHLPTGVFFVHGPTGQPLFVNARARQLLGRREDQAAGLVHLPQVYRLHRSDGSPYPWEELPVSRALREGLSSMRDDVVVYRADGRRVPLVTWAAPVDLSGPDARDGAVWVLEDLSAVRQAEAAYREAEARLRTVIQTMAEGLLVLDAEGAIVEWNPAACSILGVVPEQMPHRHYLAPAEGVCREDGGALPADEHPDRVALRTGQPVRDVVLGIPRLRVEEPPTEPATAWVLVTAMPLSAGASKGRVVVTFADVTAQRRAAEVLRQSEARYRGLVEGLPVLVLQLDGRRCITYLNPAAEAATGYLRKPSEDRGSRMETEGCASRSSILDPRSSILDPCWQELIHPDDLSEALALLEQAERGHTVRGEFRYRGRDGCERVGHALVQPAAPGASGVLLLVVDMTQQRRLEQDLRRVQRLELVGRLAGGVIHDLNNLLTVVMTLADLARLGLSEGHPVHADLARIGEAGAQAGRLVGQLLAFGKGQPVKACRVDVDGVVRASLDLLRGALPPNVEVQTLLAAGAARALADETQLEQVVMNLCLNARDAMPEGGHLTVETAADASERCVRLTVRDTGHGMDDEVRAHLFDLFFTTRERGSGLGLAVVKQVVERFGGRIEVWSRPGAGTRLDVWLPAAGCDEAR
ncbi:MAG: PAS domain S-box protein [Gemmataceae bacterium]|nr:PAS domain S-box protein [Gemmataceae bacterium]